MSDTDYERRELSRTTTAAIVTAILLICTIIVGIKLLEHFG